MADDDWTTITDIPDDQLWATAHERTEELLALLDPDHRYQAVLGIPYWLLVRMHVTAITVTTDELMKRADALPKGKSPFR